MSSTLRSERQQHLDVERNLREQLEAQAGAVHATIAELRSELERAANDLRLREQREAELQRIIEEFVTLATALRENFEREMADARRDLEVRVAAERDSYSRELGHLEARVAELRSQLEHAAELSEQLELRTSTETQATQALAAARAELERLRQSEARARGEVARLRAEHDRSRPGSISEGARRSASAGADSTPPPVSEEGAGRSTPPAQDRPPAPGEGRRAGPGQPRSTESAEAGALASDLADAFRRLREQVSQVAAQAQHPVLPQERPVGPKDDLAPPDRADAPPGDEAPAGRDEAERLEPSTGSELAPPDRPGPTAAEPLTPWRRHLLWTLGRTRAGESWITSAIVRLAQGGDRRAAGRLLVGLLPVQGVLIDHELTYDLEIRELGRFRVLVGRGTAEVRPLAPGAHPDSRPPEFGLSGDAAELAPLAGGSSPRRLRGVSITGRRRGVRRLLRGLGQPVTFEDLLRAGIRPDPLVLLRAVVAVIDPAWTAGREFSVAYVIEAEHGASRIGPYRVAVTPGEAVRVLETSVAVGSPPLAATVLVAERALMPLLAGLPLPAGERAEIEGDAAAVLLLGSWIERAQTEPAPGR